jgi:hypothetical protein
VHSKASSIESLSIPFSKASSFKAIDDRCHCRWTYAHFFNELFGCHGASAMKKTKALEISKVDSQPLSNCLLMPYHLKSEFTELKSFACGMWHYSRSCVHISTILVLYNHGNIMGKLKNGKEAMTTAGEQLSLSVFVFSIGLGIGAGIYEARVVYPNWALDPSPQTLAAKLISSGQAGAGRRFWLYVSPASMLLALFNVYLAWHHTGILRIFGSRLR